MAKTNVQRNASYYDKIIKEAEQSSHAPNYKKVCTALKGLVQLTNRLNNPEYEMSSKEYEALSNRYKDVQDACKEYLAGKAEFDEFERNREGIIADISSVVDKDIAALLQCDPLKPGSLSEVMEKSRMRTVVLNDKTINNVGAAMSSRTPIKLNNGVKGFFTPKSEYNQDDAWKKQIEKFEGAFSGISEDCKKKLELLKSNEEAQNEFSNYNPPFPVKHDKRNEPAVKTYMYRVAVQLGMGKDEKEVIRLFSKKKGLYDTLVDFSGALSPITRKQGVMAVSGIKKGDIISSRNCAMTDVAKMLGCQNLIAKSIPMKVEINGKTVEGVFMEAAEGSDIDNLKVDDPLMKAKENSFKSKEALQQLADLQVLDFICGNTDRHMGNLFYKFKKDSKGEVKFVGVQGIDNDCSFGRIKITPPKRIMRMVNIKDMRYISESMALRINNIKKEMLELKLAHNDLSAPEIAGVMERLQMVDEAVKNKTIQTVNQDYWLKHRIAIDQTERNYFPYIKEMEGLCKSKYFMNYTGPKDTIKYAQEKNTAGEIMAGKDKKISDLRKMMDASKAFFNTSEYKLMEKSFEKIERLTDKVKGHQFKKLIPEKLTNELSEAYKEMYEKTDRYIALKKVLPYTERGQKRVNVAKGLKKLAEETLDELGIKFEKENEKKQEDKNIGKNEKENDGPKL